ncbi:MULTISPECIES: hypothetical protein [unclassified Bradyrhizobium]|uniref:hypothetical protein n=1 Tax=unclassified Bradyrhizobium TaxID=2631580 RepID=UPI001FF96EEA|nr:MULTISPECIES: hypothetical protein [unclassified Bradyrhizobium]MCK1707682.1 hypothetical protein [Bradyrhizobium sp. 143]MCK1731754.1 hypothetical protein [Bradyrhizobium sp. 142]
MWRTLPRGLLLLWGLLGVFWSSFALPSFSLTAPAREVATRIIADERFKRSALSEMLARMKIAPRPCVVQPEFSRADALITLRTAEEVLQRKSSEEADREVESAENKIRIGLAMTPSDSFLWLMLYSVQTVRKGFDLPNIANLDQSYYEGPNEGWISLRRNRLALAVFPLLSENTQESVIAEFAKMVDSGFIDDAAMNLAGVGWPYRDRLLSSLQQVDITDRLSLARQLSRDSVKVVVPGTETEERPWR